MNILILHNKYLIPGGEDYCFENDVELLKSRGHSVFEIVLDNKEILKLGKLRTALRTIWSVDSYKIVKSFLKSTPCQFIIAHNLFPLFSPSVYHAVYLLKTPIIQVLHNYRISCINGLFLRNNHICEDCVGKFFPWPGVIHKCYRNSFLGSLSVVMMLFVHRLLKTWNEKVNGYIALTDFAKNEYIQSGLPSNKIFIKPNYLYADPGKGEYKEKQACDSV